MVEGQSKDGATLEHLVDPHYVSGSGTTLGIEWGGGCDSDWHTEIKLSKLIICMLNANNFYRIAKSFRLEKTVRITESKL